MLVPFDDPTAWIDIPTITEADLAIQTFRIANPPYSICDEACSKPLLDEYRSEHPQNYTGLIIGTVSDSPG